MICPKCGIEMLQLQGWDFLHTVCLNPVHPKPVHYNATWCCGKGKVTERELTESEQKSIDDRKTNLIQGLLVVKTNWELLQEVFAFLSGGFNPDIRERYRKIGEEILKYADGKQAEVYRDLIKNCIPLINKHMPECGMCGEKEGVLVGRPFAGGVYPYYCKRCHSIVDDFIKFAKVPRNKERNALLHKWIKAKDEHERFIKKIKAEGNEQKKQDV